MNEVSSNVYDEAFGRVCLGCAEMAVDMGYAVILRPTGGTEVVCADCWPEVFELIETQRADVALNLLREYDERRLDLKRLRGDS